MRPIIALLGMKGAGKATVARHLTRERGFTSLGMAAPVEAMLQAGLGIDPAIYSTDACRRPFAGAGGASPANLRNSLFHDWGRRGVHGNLWATAWRRMVAASAAEAIVVKDAAYPAEIEAVRAEGGVIWRVERPGLVPTRLVDDIQAKVVADHTIVNRDDEGALYRLVDVALRTLGGEHE